MGCTKPPSKTLPVVQDQAVCSCLQPPMSSFTLHGLNLQPGWEDPLYAPTSLSTLDVSASWDAFPCPHLWLFIPSQIGLYLLGILRTLLVSHTGPEIQV